MCIKGFLCFVLFQQGYFLQLAYNSKKIKQLKSLIGSISSSTDTQ